MGHENGGWMNDDQRDHSRWLSEQACKTYGCHDCGEERFPRTVGGELSCSECGSKNIVCIAEGTPVAPETWSDADKREALESVEPAMERTVTEAEHLAGRLKYLESLHKLRQESGITAAMLRDGRAKGFIDAFKVILRWCDRSGEEPEGQCLHEIEQICRRQLGLELLKPEPPCRPNGFGLCMTHKTCDHVKHALENSQAIVEEYRAKERLENKIKTAETDQCKALLGRVYREAGNESPGFKRHALTPGLRDDIRDLLKTTNFFEPKPSHDWCANVECKICEARRIEVYGRNTSLPKGELSE